MIVLILARSIVRHRTLKVPLVSSGQMLHRARTVISSYSGVGITTGMAESFVDVRHGPTKLSDIIATRRAVWVNLIERIVPLPGLLFR